MGPSVTSNLLRKMQRMSGRSILPPHLHAGTESEALGRQAESPYRSARRGGVQGWGNPHMQDQARGGCSGPRAAGHEGWLGAAPVVFGVVRVSMVSRAPALHIPARSRRGVHCPDQRRCRGFGHGGFTAVAPPGVRARRPCSCAAALADVDQDRLEQRFKQNKHQPKIRPTNRLGGPAGEHRHGRHDSKRGTGAPAQLHGHHYRGGNAAATKPERCIAEALKKGAIRL